MIILVNVFWYDFTFYVSSLTVPSAKEAIKNKNERDFKLFQPYFCTMIFHYRFRESPKCTFTHLDIPFIYMTKSSKAH